MADSKHVVTVTDANFANEVAASSDLVMVDFWAAWCGPCRLIAPTVEQLAEEYAGKGLKVGKLDVDQNPQLAGNFGVRSIPTILFFRDGKVVDQLIGALPKAHFAEKIDALLAG